MFFRGRGHRRHALLASGFALLAAGLAPCLTGQATAPDTLLPSMRPGIAIHGSSVVVRPDLAFAADFVKVLTDHGVKVRALNHSIYNGFFEDAHEAAHLSTDLGVVEVVVFPYPVVTKVKVTRMYDAEGGVFLYNVQRHPGEDGSTTIDSPCRNAILMANRWFIFTDSERLADVLDKALHPTLPRDIPEF